MPLFDQQTSLQGQGRFAPGVNYYAGIRKPDQPVPNLPEVNESFNIDLSRIGDAMIASEENKLKAGMALLESADKWKLAEMEDTRARDLAEMQKKTAYDQMSLQWNIAKMNDETNRLRIEKEKEKAAKDTSKQEAINYMLKNIRPYFADFKNNKMGYDELMSHVNDISDDIMAMYPNVSLSDVTSAVNVRYPGIYKFETQEQQFIADKNNELYLSMGEQVAPGASNEEKINLGKQIVDNFYRYKQANQVIDDPNSTPEQIAQARVTRSTVAGGIARDMLMNEVYGDINNLIANIKNGANVQDYYEYSKNKYIQRSVEILNTAPTQAANEFDLMWDLWGGKKYMDTVVSMTKQNAEMSQYLLSITKNEAGARVLGLPGAAQFIAYKDMLGISYNDLTPEGKDHVTALGNYIYSVKSNEDKSYDVRMYGELIDKASPEVVQGMMMLYGVTPKQAAVMSMFVSAKKAKENSINGGYNYTERQQQRILNAEYLAGLGSTDGEIQPNDLPNVGVNAKKQIESGNLNPKADIEWCKEKGYNAPDVCNLAWGSYKVHEQLGEDPEFHNKLEYLLDPINIKHIKNSKVVIQEKDDKVSVQIYGDGFLEGVGQEVRDAYAMDVNNTLGKLAKVKDVSAKDITSYLKVVYKDKDVAFVGPEWKPDDKPLLNRILDPLTNMLSSGQVLDTFYKGEIANVGNKPNQSESPVQRQSTNAEIINPTSTATVAPTQDFSTWGTVKYNSAGEAVTMLTETVQNPADGLWYVVPTLSEVGEPVEAELMLQNGIHFGGYKTQQEADKAARLMSEIKGMYLGN